MLPALDLQGRILLEDKCRISWAANGNGGLYEALYTSKALQDMAQYDDLVVL
jgi:UDP-N-acetylglucosamine pyrophosphorylase